MGIISDCLDTLYKKADARNFIIMDVPPMDRCPDSEFTEHPGGSAQSILFTGNLHDMNDVIASRVGL